MYPNNNTSPSPPQPQWQPPVPPPPPYQPQVPAEPPRPMPPNDPPQLPDPTVPAPLPEEPAQPNKRRKLLGIAGAVLAIILLATGTYFVFLKDRIGNTGNAEQDHSKATPLSSRQEVALIPPADLSKYRANPDNSATRMEYVSEDGSCTLRIAILDKKDLPGSNMNELAAAHIKTLRDRGFTIAATRNDEADLELTDITDSSKTYSLQTVAVEASHNGKYAATHMSAAILKDGKRAHITRSCESENKQAAQEKLGPLDADATKVTVLAK